MAAPAPSHTGQSAGGFSNTATATIPAGAAVGSLCLIHFEWRANVTFSSIAGVSGLAQLGSEAASGTSSSDVRTRVYWKVLESGDPGTTVTVTLSGSAYTSLQVLVVTGFNSTTPLPVVQNSNGGATAGTTATLTGLTSPGADHLLVGQVGANNNADPGTNSFTPPGSMVERVDVSNQGRMAGTVATETVGAGATGSRAFTIEDSSRWAGKLYVIAPAAASSQDESGGSSASVTVSAAGGGTAAEAMSSGSTATVPTSTAGAGTAVEAVSGGSTATVDVAAAGAGFNPGIVTPNDRTVTIPAEPRVFHITAEDRTLRVPAEDRTLEVTR